MKNTIHKVLTIVLILFYLIICPMTPVQAKNASAVSPETAADPLMVLVRITTGDSTEIKNCTSTPLILNKKGYVYEPIINNKLNKLNKLNTIKNNIEIKEENITLQNISIEGNLYISSNSITLKNLYVSGKITIMPGVIGNCYLDNIITEKIEVLSDAVELARPESNSFEIGKPGSESHNIAFLEIVTVSDYNDKLVVVNKNRGLPSNWKPNDLVALKVPYKGRAEARYMKKEASDALVNLFSKAKESRINLYAVSGFRSYELQKAVYRKNVSLLGNEAASMVSAISGKSEHQTGLAVDISTRYMGYQLDKSFGKTREGKWLKQNAAEYGFIIRYPEGKEAVTGYSYEPWHIRYVGREMAMEIMKKGTTLEEYLGLYASP